MKTILVPTDFSKLSKVAVSYAIGLAKHLEARVVLLSIINVGDTSEGGPNWRKLEKSLIETAERDADQLMDEIREEKGKVDVSVRHERGFPIAERIEEFAVKNKINLIVMGSKGASGLRKVFFGSNAAAVVDNSSVPVIVVPGKAKYNPIKKLLYATDGKNFQKEVKALITISQMVDAHLDVVHVVPKGDLKGKEGETASALKKELTAAAKDPRINVHIVPAKGVAEGVSDFAHHHKVDLLAMFTHQLDYKEKVLGRSVTRSLALDTNIPLLTFNRTKR